MLSVANVLGRLLMVLSLTYLLPIICSLIYRDGTFLTFLVSQAACLAAGGLMTLATRRFQRELKPRDGFMLVTLAWVLTATIATFPLLLHLELSFSDAFFEAMSGMTTTGATVITGLEALPASIDLWRHELNWIGGRDFISAFSAVIACIDNAGPGLGAVGPGTNYSSLTDYEIWVLSFTMLLGRLEVFSLLVLFTPQFWRK
ncbi:hypothetical protein G3446_18600 [Thiorhodococcus minor]|uniref:TrkH family potassium uptake protein n=1 Tax=Thiorhodococcus minor TaxID=57489 RepID=A0A6M0K3Q3_9GAMM|nr:hypothetical protein [Thiorhodococcus minor]